MKRIARLSPALAAIVVFGFAATDPARAAEPPSFMLDVAPLLDSLGCNSAQCHGSAAGKGGFRLSMFGADRQLEYVAVTRAEEGRRIDPFAPAESLILLKATGAVEHGGGKRLDKDAAEYDLLLEWIRRGAPLKPASGVTLQRIEVDPADVKLAPQASQKLTVQAVFSDGTQRDVTSLARFESLDDRICRIDAQGVPTAVGHGQTHIRVAYNRRFALARIVVPRKLEGGFPQAASNNRIDELVSAKLAELGIPPSDVCSDDVFIRRVTLDTLGRLPTPQEVKAFLADKSPDKRSKLIDRLLESTEFADNAALKWGDLLRIKAEFPSNLWPNAVHAYYRWIRDSFAQNKPYDEFVRELLVSSGSNFRDPPANYYRAMEKRDPVAFAESTALVFMGVRLECARCHGHPNEPWTLDDDVAMGAFFSQVRFKSTKEWKEEIVYVDPRITYRHPITRQTVVPRFLDGKTPEIPPNTDPRAVFADWLTSPENPYFAKNIVNRIWFWLFGRGIVHEPDDMHPTNPPSNPALLDYLAEELVKNDYDLKSVYRLILNSATYQRSSKTVPGNEEDETYFSHYVPRRLSAEVLSDAIGDVTQRWDRFESRVPEPYSNWPLGYRATRMFDGSVNTPFLEMFGRPPRDTSYECDRDNTPSMRQAIYLVASSTLESKVTGSPRIQAWIRNKLPDDQIVDELFLLAFSRPPSEQEKATALDYLKQNATNASARTQAVQDLMWAALNSKEFLFQH
ncbi:DUF1549 domain-containing protein [Thermostilla marina]